VCVEQEIGDSLLPISVQTDLKSSPTYQVLYENLLYFLFVFLGPLLILIVLNACLIQVVYRAALVAHKQSIVVVVYAAFSRI